MKTNIYTNDKNGFSLLELTIVLAIIAILIGTVTPIVITAAKIRATEKISMDVRNIQEAAVNFYTDHNTWPVNFNELKNNGYLNPKWDLLHPLSGSEYRMLTTGSTFTVQFSIEPDFAIATINHLPAATITEHGNWSEIESTISAPGSSIIETSAVMLWTGNIADIPTGWHICDGAHGTPDLSFFEGYPFIMKL